MPLPRPLPPARGAVVWLLLSAALMLALSGAQAQARDRPPPSRAAGVLSAALTLGQVGGNWGAGAELVRGGDATSVAVFEWFRLRAGAGTPDDADRWLRARPHWPMAQSIQRAAEGQFQDAPSAEVRRFFAERAPLSTDGALALLATLPPGAEAQDLARRLWLEHSLSQAQEAALLAAHGAALAPLHAERLDRLLWRAALPEAERMLERVPPDLARLGRARLAVQTRADGAEALLAGVPAALADDPGLTHDRFQWHMETGQQPAAGDLLIERSR